MAYADEEVIRILIVDDDDDERELFTETLKKLNLHHVLYSASGSTELFKQLALKPLPHVIFMDINMPLPNGHECLQKLKADDSYAHIPVLMYSVSSSPLDIEDAFQGGAHYYVIKPHAPVNLVGTLRRALALNWIKPQPIPERNDFVVHLSFTN